MDVQLPDGTVIKDVPDGMSKADLVAKLKSNGYDTTKLEAGATFSEKPGGLESLGAGLGKGFGQVVLNAQKYAGKGIRSLGDLVSPDENSLTSLVTGQKNRGLVQKAGDWLVNDADQGLAKIAGENAPYKEAHPYINGAGEIGGNIVATAPVGGLLAKGAGAIPGVAKLAPNLLTSIETSGMTAGNVAPGVGNAIANMATRVAGGAITGGVSAGLVDPSQAKTGAVIGGAFPIAAKVAGEAGNYIGTKISDIMSESVAKRLMQSAIKPTIKQLKSGEAQTAVETLLENGINPTAGGVNKLRALIDSKNAEIANEIATSGATVDKQNVLAALANVRQKFGNQVSPTGDLASIQKVTDDFMAHPNLPGSTIPVQAAQDLKQGTYRVLSGKYGQMGSAETEAQKALARGLKDEIATAVPAVGPLNAEESKLLTTLSVAERRALMELNKNPMGLASLAHNPLSWAAFMADKSALFKSLAARAVNQMADAPNAIQGALGNQAVQRIGYQAAPVALSAQ